jgi:endonuclease/exonuclease/phosphatase family metal-dependent hydrolase
VFTAAVLVVCASGGCKSPHESPGAQGAVLATNRTGTLAAAPNQHSVAQSSQPNARRSFSVATYNAGLAVGVLPHAAERAPHAISALAGLAADLLCVQEVWLPSHWQELVRVFGKRARHALRPPALSGDSGRCTAAEAAPALACVRRHCESAAESALALCAAAHCAGHAAALSPACAACLTKNPLRSLSQTASECVSSAGDTTRAAAAGTPARAYVYGGSYGIGMLTSESVLEDDFLRFESEQLARGALYAKVRTGTELGDVHFFCTHLTADTRSIPFPDRVRSWSSEHEREVSDLLAWMERKAQGGPIVLLGDLNTGPALGRAAHARAPKQYERFLQAGFQNAYVETPTAACTFCNSNLVSGGAGRGGSLIDHVLLRGTLATSRVWRELDAPLELSVGQRRIKTHLSDHYALVAELTR